LLCIIFVATAVMPGSMPTMFGIPISPIFMLLLPIGDSWRCGWRFLVMISSPQKVKKIVTSIPLPSAAQPMTSAG